MLRNRVTRRIEKLLLLLTAFGLFVTTAPARQSPSDHLKQEAIQKAAGVVVAPGEDRESLRHYKGENGIMSAKTLVLGGEFRVTTVIPFKGNFAEYHHLEIARPVSFVGGALKPQVASEQAAKFKSQFESRRLFKSVVVIDSYDPATQQEQAQTSASDVDVTESLDSPIGAFESLIARDRLRVLREQQGEQPAADKTLVAVIEVLDYAKGNRWKQALPLDLGKSILTVRLRYYDKSTGEEIGRQIISGQSDGSSLLGPLSPRDGLSGVADGFVDQVTRRVAASEK